MHDFLLSFLPETVKKEIDLSEIKIDLTGFVSEEIKEYCADVVVKAQLRRGAPPCALTHPPPCAPAKSCKAADVSQEKEQLNQAVDIYILFEHKSYIDKWIFVQLIRYMCQMWENDARDKKPLRIILPFVFYHGERNWNIPEEFVEQFNVNKDLKDYLLNFRYMLFDTNAWSLENKANLQLRKNIHLFSALGLMKAAYEKDLTSINKIIAFWSEMGFIDTEDVIIYMRYVVSSKDISKQQLFDILEESRAKGENIMPTLAERWIEEGFEKGERLGIEKGIEKGREEGLEKGEKKGVEKDRIKICKKLLFEGSDYRFIEKICEFSSEKIKAIEAELKNAGKL